MLAATLAGCHPSERFESVGQIVHSEVIEADDKSKPLVHEIEFEWSPCPGDQFQVVRGGAEFAECVKQYAVGEMATIHVQRFGDGRGYYRWDVTRIGECERPMQPDAEGSYEKSAECTDVCCRSPFLVIPRSLHLG
jgi:hypothetical protein